MDRFLDALNLSSGDPNDSYCLAETTLKAGSGEHRVGCDAADPLAIGRDAGTFRPVAPQPDG